MHVISKIAALSSKFYVFRPHPETFVNQEVYRNLGVFHVASTFESFYTPSHLRHCQVDNSGGLAFFWSATEGLLSLRVVLCLC